jgi:HPt (histidine-containing phosphotransfer) domain-containing protein
MHGFPMINHLASDRTMSREIVSSSPILDVKGSLARFDGDELLFREIITFFLEDAPPLVAELRRAAAIPHAQAVRSTAHALKGLAAGCGGVRAAQAAGRVEHAAQAGDLENIVPLVDDVTSEIECLAQAARAFRA